MMDCVLGRDVRRLLTRHPLSLNVIYWFYKKKKNLNKKRDALFEMCEKNICSLLFFSFLPKGDLLPT